MTKLSNLDYSNVPGWKYQDMPEGLVTEAGASAKYITGGWRSIRPVWNQESCTDCMLCWIACPDSSILVADGAMTGIDYDHCKGCGVCAKECRLGVLKMVPEHHEEA